MKGSLNLKTITHFYRILGLPIEASLEDCRKSRNSLLQKFHPDKQPKGWLQEGVTAEDRVHLIQEAYLYIRKNFQEIQAFLKPMKKNQLTTKIPKDSRSHWVYTEIQNNTKK
jgi:curved DNA-binding protein CbpA